MGNPWEIARNDISYPVKFYGEVISGTDGGKQWVGGEDVTAVAYDVPIPGYKTKTTINLRLWSTKVAPEQFNLSSFNVGDHANADAAIKKAEKVWKFHDRPAETFCFNFYHLLSDLCSFKFLNPKFSYLNRLLIVLK